ncbi:MAG: hypothetical protein FD167_1083 [bacterium]|nr:MAG: hypothetical protein FD167_1083 [bacterium]
MLAHPKHYFTLDEYLAVEKVGNARYEYWDSDIVCMGGGSPEHGRIGGNIYFRLRIQLTGKTCEAFTNEFAINTPLLPPYRYPDASVACGRAIFERISGIGVLTNPVVIFEVLSPNTEAADRGQKLLAYRAIETLQEYVLVSQTRPHITHYIKQENGEWSSSDIVEWTATLTLNSIGCSLAFSDIYEGIEFN